MKFLSVSVGLLVLYSGLVQANPDVNSREYKLMLDYSAFDYTTEYSNIQSLMADAKTVIEAAINRSVTGTAQLEYQRKVAFFDTKSSCLLNSIGYAFRERIDNSQSEVTLKFRSTDRYISDFEDLSSHTNGAETKLEADVGISTDSNFRVQYGHSTTAPNIRTINKMNDIHAHFSGFDNDYGFSDTLALDKVGNLTISERVYKSVFIDLGQFDAQFSTTLWYEGDPAINTTPVVAEVSFKYKDSSANYTQKVVSRAKDAFEALQGMSRWVDNRALTKTRFVYEYDQNFCQ
jgi:hypothetical protein